MRGFLLVMSVALAPAQVRVPERVQQGDTLRVLAPGSGTVEMDGRNAQLFRQSDGGYLALMPVPVTAEPGKHEISVNGSKFPVEVLEAHFPVQNVRVGKRTKALRPLPGEMEAINAFKQTVTPVRFWTEPFAKPTPDCMNSPFGVLRYHNGKPTGTYHKGEDLRSPAGRPIRATAEGSVTVVHMFRLHGGTVGIDHGQGVTSLYLHMSRIAVREGQHVKEGDVIGYVGATGFATGPHLHWQILVHGVPVNPVQWTGPVQRCE